MNRPVAIGGLLLSLSLTLAGCGSGSANPSPAAATPVPTSAVTTAPTPAPTATPTPTPTPVRLPTPAEVPTPVPSPTTPPVPQPSDDELIAACAAGTPVPGAAPYAGTLHPLVVVYTDGLQWWVDDDATSRPYDVDNKWIDDAWPSSVQLVACQDNRLEVKADSCGTYTRQRDGVTGEVIRYKEAQTVRILVAKTGKLLQSQTYYGSLPDCPTAFQDVAGKEPP
jgi:hypothetical protein